MSRSGRIVAGSTLAGTRFTNRNPLIRTPGPGRSAASAYAPSSSQIRLRRVHSAIKARGGGVRGAVRVTDLVYSLTTERGVRTPEGCLSDPEWSPALL